jgi:hypothetical protein
VKFEIINPSDAYTMEAVDLQVAAVACCFLGDGRYGLDALDEDRNKDGGMPIFLLGGHDEWFASKFGLTFEACAENAMKHRADDMANALDSVALKSGERTSMNNIGARAKALAKAIRTQAG